MSQNLRFVIVPKVAHPWFEEVFKGARAEAESLSQAAGCHIAIEYAPPSVCDIDEQNQLLHELCKSEPDGIAVDPVDAIGNLTAIHHIRAQHIPVVLFDSPSPDPRITSIGNDFDQQGVLAAERLASLIGYEGKVAIMKGFPTAPNHKARYEAQWRVLSEHPLIRIVNGGTDNDDIATARREALAVLEAHPDLNGYLCCDASGPIGIAEAVKQSGRIGTVMVVGMDGIAPIVQAIKDGILESSSATIPTMQGAMCTLMLWRATLGLTLPQRVDTGIDLITRDNVDAFLTDTRAGTTSPSTH